MLTPKDYDRIAFEEKLFNVAKHALWLGIVVILALVSFDYLGECIDKDNAFTDKIVQSYK